MTELPLNESITELQHWNIYKRRFLKNKAKPQLFAIRKKKVQAVEYMCSMVKTPFLEATCTPTVDQLL